MSELEFSIVVPVRSESSILSSTLPSCYSLGPREVIVCLDDPPNLTDLKAVEYIAEKCGWKDTTKILKVPENPACLNQLAWQRRQGFLAASNDRILSTDADLILNRNVRKSLLRVGKDNVGYASCTTIYPVNGTVRFCQSVVHGLVSRFRPPTLTGLYALWRPYWLDSEDYGIRLLRWRAGEDRYLLNCMKKNHRAIHLRQAAAYSLRPYHTVADAQAQYELGSQYANAKLQSWSVFLRSVALLQPHLFRGYVDQLETKRT